VKLSLDYGRRPGWVSLRELRGADEEMVEATDSASAIALLDRVLLAEPGVTLGPGQAVELVVPDRDRLLAAVYVRSFGLQVESTVCCRCCERRFDLDFSLQDLLHTLRNVSRPPSADDGLFALPDGRRFRLPTGVDEQAVAPLPPEEQEPTLLARCLVDNGAAVDADALARGMRLAAPLLDLDVDARCPECGESQTVRFDMQHYLLARILEERRLRAWEFHRLARAYGWSRTEILDVPRSRRRLHVDLIERDAAAR
jgi:hypothetical protein